MRAGWCWLGLAGEGAAGTATSSSPPSPRPLHPAARRPKSPCAGMTLYQVLHELQIVLAVILGACPLRCQPLTLDRLAAALARTNKGLLGAGTPPSGPHAGTVGHL
jgi:hypothetical protein